MTNYYDYPVERRETFTEKQVREISESVTRAVEKELTRQYKSMNCNSSVTSSFSKRK